MARRQLLAAASYSACWSGPSSSASRRFSASVTGSCASISAEVCAWAMADRLQSSAMSLWQSAHVSAEAYELASSPRTASWAPRTSHMW